MSEPAVLLDFPESEFEPPRKKTEPVPKRRDEVEDGVGHGTAAEADAAVGLAHVDNADEGTEGAD